MRRQPIIIRALFALVIAWLAVNASPRSAADASGRSVGSVHGDTVALSPPYANIRGVASSKKASPSDWPGRAFLGMFRPHC